MDTLTLGQLQTGRGCSEEVEIPEFRSLIIQHFRASFAEQPFSIRHEIRNLPNQEIPSTLNAIVQDANEADFRMVTLKDHVPSEEEVRDIANGVFPLYGIDGDQATQHQRIRSYADQFVQYLTTLVLEIPSKTASSTDASEIGCSTYQSLHSFMTAHVHQEPRARTAPSSANIWTSSEGSHSILQEANRVGKEARGDEFLGVCCMLKNNNSSSHSVCCVGPIALECITPELTRSAVPTPSSVPAPRSSSMPACRSAASLRQIRNRSMRSLGDALDERDEADLRAALQPLVYQRTQSWVNNLQTPEAPEPRSSSTPPRRRALFFIPDEPTSTIGTPPEREDGSMIMLPDPLSDTPSFSTSSLTTSPRIIVQMDGPISRGDLVPPCPSLSDSVSSSLQGEPPTSQTADPTSSPLPTIGRFGESEAARTAHPDAVSALREHQRAREARHDFDTESSLPFQARQDGRSMTPSRIMTNPYQEEQEELYQRHLASLERRYFEAEQRENDGLGQRHLSSFRRQVSTRSPSFRPSELRPLSTMQEISSDVNISPTNTMTTMRMPTLPTSQLLVFPPPILSQENQGDDSNASEFGVTTYMTAGKDHPEFQEPRGFAAQAKTLHVAGSGAEVHPRFEPRDSVFQDQAACETFVQGYPKHEGSKSRMENANSHHGGTTL